ncbi:FKBP-type peptidyl-prolyl cis-trans isomerase [Planctomycetota bacterium]
MSFKTPVMLILCLVFLTAGLQAADKTSSAAGKLESDFDKTSYALGTTVGNQIGNMLKARETEVNFDLFVVGIKDTLVQNPLALSETEIKNVMDVLNQKMMALMQKQQAEQAKIQAEQAKQMEAQGKKQLALGKPFLEANAKKDGVKVSVSGLQYRVMMEGKGDKPKATDTVKVHYKGSLANGTVFDSSYQRNKPEQFPLTAVVPGWTEGLQLMNVGAKYELVIPSGLGYGLEGRPPHIPPNAVLIFEVELLEIIK